MSRQYATVVELLETAFAQYPDKPAYTCMGHTLTFAELDQLSRQFAAFLQQELGLRSGQRIALQMPNILQFPVALYGAVRAGLTIVNSNPLYTSREIKHQLSDSGAEALVVLSNVAAETAEIIQDTAVKHVIVTDIADLHPQPKRSLLNFAVRYVKRMVPAFHFPHSITFRRALSLGSKARLQAPTDIHGESILALQYTGGTTGIAKGAMLTHNNLCANVRQVIDHMPDLFVEKNLCFAAPLPLYHVYAFNLHALAAFSMGAHNVLIPNPRDIPALVSVLRKHPPTVFLGLNTLFNALCRNKDFCELDFSRLTCTSSGGMALTESTAKCWQEVTGVNIVEGYGLTETSPVVSSCQRDQIKRGTVGTALPDTEVRVTDDSGQPLATSEVGELCVRGPQVMLGYWQKPEETAAVLSADGWFKTGDMATIDAEGFIRIVDRKKDLIIVSGFNVYPNEVEDAVSQHPGILEAAAVGLPDDKSGERVKLFVVRSDDSVTEEDVLDYCRENMTNYKVPRAIEFRDTLPKSNVGKILRRSLRDEEMEKIKASSVSADSR